MEIVIETGKLIFHGLSLAAPTVIAVIFWSLVLFVIVVILNVFLPKE